MLKEISVDRIAAEIARLCVQANRQLPCDISGRLESSIKTETNPLAIKILEDLKLNLKVADELKIPVCQDTGMSVVFLDVGQDVHFTGGSLEDAVNEGVRQGYKQGLLRMSVVADPLKRVNTSDNTPAIIHIRIVPGNRVKITVAPKGFGSENMSGIRMLTPAATREDVIAAVVDVVKQAASNPCPPMVIGVGIGGDFEMCALLAKKALCRSLDIPHPDPYYAQLEKDMLEEINKLGIGPQGFGGKTTALGLNIETFATHIAGLPVAVNIGCHVTRHAEVIID
ncbi:MAG TPA: fumarate hydratase [Clostridiales bacterium]|nr:fumarate hydratase [Clostridiales bacterium]